MKETADSGEQISCLAGNQWQFFETGHVISDIRIKTDVADVGNIVSVAANQIQWYRCTAELG